MRAHAVARTAHPGHEQLRVWWSTWITSGCGLALDVWVASQLWCRSVRRFGAVRLGDVGLVLHDGVQVGGLLAVQVE